MMPDGDTAAHLREQVGGLFFGAQVSALLLGRSIMGGSANSGMAVMNGMLSVDQLWLTIRREAESAVARDPVFGAALSSSILDHPDFAHALAHQIGARLGKGPT